MAQRIHTILVDDLTGEPAAETVRFGLDGRYYEIDLTKENTRELRAALKPYVRRAHQGAPPTSAQEAARIRSWAEQNGHEVAARGPVPMDIIDAYRQAL